MTMASRPAEPAAKLFFLSLVACAAAALAAAAGAAGARGDQYAAMTLTVVNNCPFTVWPAVAPSSGGEVVAGGGFELPTLSHRSFPAPARPWSGRIWARTACYPGPNGALHCATGDCAGRLQCAGLAGKPPATLIQVTLHHGGERDQTSYGVSVVDGFNVGASVTPHEGRGVCPVLGCREDLTATCPGELQLRAPQGGGGGVLGCKSGCEAFGTDELCCRN
ncbi:Osmotin-like protein, partial [Ananas comosus]